MRSLIDDNFYISVGGFTGETANKYVPPQLTVRRSFVARNVGEIPLDIQVVEIYPAQGTLSFWAAFTLGQPDSCEGYGFRILNCQPFTLLPNHTHTLDIAFTPDFTMSRVVRTLRLTDINGAVSQHKACTSPTELPKKYSAKSVSVPKSVAPLT